jgi:hypothetical protein
LIDANIRALIMECPDSPARGELAEAFLYLKGRLKATEAELYQERRRQGELGQALAQSNADCAKYHELSLAQQKDIISLRRELAELKEKHSQACFEGNRRLEEAEARAR